MQIIPVGPKGKINSMNRAGENKGGGQCFCSVIFNYRQYKINIERFCREC